jgi:hypothetical protein
LPDEASRGPTPQSLAKAGSELTRSGVVPGGEEELGRDVGSHAADGNEGGSGCGDDQLQLDVQGFDLLVQSPVAPGKRAQGEPEAGGGTVHLTGAQPQPMWTRLGNRLATQLLTQLGRGARRSRARDCLCAKVWDLSTQGSLEAGNGREPPSPGNVLVASSGLAAGRPGSRRTRKHWG